MSSSATRADIVGRALKLAGRGNEIKALANDLLDDMLRAWALEYRYPSLRKVGSALILLTGQTTVSLPGDFGAGMDNLTFGTENVPLQEASMDEFIALRGFQDQNASTGRPTLYCVDREAGLIRFNATADRDYPLMPIYFKLPARIGSDATGDNQKIWVDDDRTAIQGLVLELYQYVGDPREFIQEKRVEDLKAAYRRGIVPMTAGGARIQLSPARFRPRR